MLELGAGTALPGLLLAKLGHQVTLSDSLVLPHTLDNCREAAKCNELQEKVQVNKLQKLEDALDDQMPSSFTCKKGSNVQA